MDVAAPPACSDSPSTAIASWLSLIRSYSTIPLIRRAFHYSPHVDTLGLGWSSQKYYFTSRRDCWVMMVMAAAMELNSLVVELVAKLVVVDKMVEVVVVVVV